MKAEKISEILKSHMQEYVVIRYAYADNTGLFEGVIGGMDEKNCVVELKNTKSILFVDYHAFQIFSVEIRPITAS